MSLGIIAGLLGAILISLQYILNEVERLRKHIEKEER